MQQDWHRSEPRLVRPFFESIGAENALDLSLIKLFEDAEASPDTSFDLDDIDFDKLKISIIPSLANPADWMPNGLSAEDLGFVLIGRHSFLKRSKILLSQSISRALPASMEIDAGTISELGGGRNMELTLALCLTSDQEARPGLPFVTGHWLARKTFSLKSHNSPSLFDLRPRTDEDWREAGYPAKSFFAVEYRGGIEAEAEEGVSIATVYVHIDAYNRMVGSQVGDMLQPILGAEIICSVLLDSLKDWKDLESVPPSSALATVIRQFEKEASFSIKDLKALVKTPALLKARLQDRLNVVRSIG